MRKYVTVHPDYADMTDWTGPETSDIVYEDTNGVLTNFLILGNYLDRDNWSKKKPKYFIEVKTTPKSSDAPFYVSKAQYSRVSIGDYRPFTACNDRATHRLVIDAQQCARFQQG